MFVPELPHGDTCSRCAYPLSTLVNCERLLEPRPVAPLNRWDLLDENMRDRRIHAPNLGEAMSVRLRKSGLGGVVLCALGLIASGPAGAQSSKSAFCSDMTHVARADATAIQHPTERDTHRLDSDLRIASAALPPATVVANRAQLVTLVASNLLGNNVPAVAATEAQYTEMWAQDTAAMFGYAASSSSSSAYTNLAPVTQYVEHACPASEKTFRKLDTSEHLHLTAGS